MPKDYNSVVISEKGFSVEFSNTGSKPKPTPNPPNPERNVVRCAYPRCRKETKSVWGLCTSHSGLKNKEKTRLGILLHKRDWVGRLLPPGYKRKQCLENIPMHFSIIDSLLGWMDDKEARKRLSDSFIADIIESFHAKVSDATALQRRYEGREKGEMHPDEIAGLMREVVNRNFPQKAYGREGVVLAKFKGFPETKMPLRIAATLLVVSVVSEEINRGDARYSLEHGKESRYANIFMPLAYYLIRRYTKATAKQAKMCIKQ